MDPMPKNAKAKLDLAVAAKIERLLGLSLTLTSSRFHPFAYKAQFEDGSGLKYQLEVDPTGEPWAAVLMEYPFGFGRTARTKVVGRGEGKSVNAALNAMKAE